MARASRLVSLVAAGATLALALIASGAWPASRSPGTEGASAPRLRPAAGTFLVARRGMPDPRFAQTVVLLVAYGREGALGLIVNRPTELPLAEVLPDVELPADDEAVLWIGGPVAPGQAAALLSTSRAPDDARPVMDSLYFSTGVQALRAVQGAGATARFRVYAGYAGWAPSQLDSELERGDWHVRAAALEQVFSADPERLWHTLIGEAGTWAWMR